LKARLASTPITMRRSVLSAVPDRGRVRLRLDDGTERRIDHVLLATGFRVDVSRYGFLSAQLLNALRLVDGYPELGPGLESSVPGLHFVGAPAAFSFGPVMRFVSGSAYAARALTRRVLGKRQPPISFSF
jgi:hypothetical protein